MDVAARWAGRYGARATFVCVSCAGPGLASTFGNELELSRCVNTFASEMDMPTWGQLGCSGFIVIDSSLRVVCPASSAFLEVREQAFKHVELLLDTLLETDGTTGSALSEIFPPGAEVVVRGLKSASGQHFNGRTGAVQSGPNANGRYVVLLAGGDEISAKSANLDFVRAASEGG